MFNYAKLDPAECEFISVGPAADIGPGERLHLEIDGQPIVIFNIAGVYFAIGDICSHDAGPLGDGELEGDEIACPRHGARFDIRSGKALSLPAVEDIPAYPVEVVNGEVLIGLPRAEV
jgi:3-phenylpropionate/trans-cinnamate dioxygenase ferredoxin subunit